MQDPEDREPTFRDKFGQHAYWIFARFGVDRPVWTLIGVGAIILICGLALPRIQTRVGLRQSLKSSTRQIQDYVWLEKTFGPLIPVEVVIKTPISEDKEEFLQEFYSLQQLAWNLQDGLPDSTIITALNFITDLPEQYERSFRATGARSTYRNVLYKNRSALEEAGYFRETDGWRYYRVTCRTFAMQDVDYDAFTNQIEQIIKATLEDEETPSAFQLENTLATGSIPLVQRVQNLLIHDLQTSFLFAFITIGIVLAIIYRSVWCGLLAVFPCIFPCVFVFGLVGLFGIKIELGTMLTGSAALGVAADDIVHFIAWFRLGATQPYHTRKDAVAFAFKNCALAMFETSAVIVVGLMSYLMSDFIPTVYFTIFMGSLLIVAHLASYIILPAILTLPTGELFLRPVRQREKLLSQEGADQTRKPAPNAKKSRKKTA
ncbi:MAG: MMPL family transporter [Thermoguttaceae bacterium]|nr:MMPL family transporter [Thermoguttaceae bacterium]